MKKILSDVYIMSKLDGLDSELIEKELAQKYGEIIRWAIIESSDNKIKISVSYKCSA